MAAFYVGQRVRKVGGDWNIGMTGVVAEIDPNDPFGYTLGVILDGHAICEMNGRLSIEIGFIGFGAPEHFEPILPPGLESDAEIDALYEPEPIHVSEAA